MSKNSVLEKFKKLSGNEYSFLMSDEENPYSIKEWLDTGCYLLNAALCEGNIFGGLALGRRYIFSGESGVAKSLLIMYIIKSYLNKFQDANIIFFETEGSSVLEQGESVKLPKDRVLILPVNSIQDFKTQSSRILNQIKEDKKKGSKERYLFVLDSLAMLGSENEMKQALEGSDKKDMSKAGEIRSVFRILTLDLSLTKTPFLISNHVYANIGGYGAQNIQSGGKAPVFAGDAIFQITKAKEKQGTERVGSILSLKIQKSRMQREDTVYKLLLLYSKGLWKYSGLLDLAIEYGIFKRSGNSYIVDDTENKITKKELVKNASIYYTQDVLEKINKHLMKQVGYGSDECIDNINYEDLDGIDYQESDD